MSTMLRLMCLLIVACAQLALASVRQDCCCHYNIAIVYTQKHDKEWRNYGFAGYCHNKYGATVDVSIWNRKDVAGSDGRFVSSVTGTDRDLYDTEVLRPERVWRLKNRFYYPNLKVCGSDEMNLFVKATFTCRRGPYKNKEYPHVWGHDEPVECDCGTTVDEILFMDLGSARNDIRQMDPSFLNEPEMGKMVGPYAPK